MPSSRSVPSLVLFVMVVCSLTPYSGQGTEIARLKLLLTADKAIYAPREPISFTLRVVNESSKPMRLSFRTSQRFDLVMRDGEGREVWRWSAGRVFAQVFGEEILPPAGGELLSQATMEGDLPRGVYTVTGLIPALEGVISARTTVTVQ